MEDFETERPNSPPKQADSKRYAYQIRKILKWLNRLALNTTHSLAKEDLEQKFHSYADMLQTFQTNKFSEASIAAASKHFKFFPSYAELAEWLENQSMTGDGDGENVDTVHKRRAWAQKVLQHRGLFNADAERVAAWVLGNEEPGYCRASPCWLCAKLRQR